MGRQPLGAEGRSVKATLRITPQEKAALVTAFGSEGKGLRALLDSYRAGWLEHPPEPPREHTAHPMVDDDTGFAAVVGASVLPVTDEQMVDMLGPQHIEGVYVEGAQDAQVVTTQQVAEAIDIPLDVLTHRNVGGDLVDPEGRLPITTARGDVYLANIPDDLLPVALEIMNAPDQATAQHIADTKSHRHKPKDKVATEFDKGTKVEIWRCECGQEIRR